MTAVAQDNVAAALLQAVETVADLKRRRLAAVQSGDEAEAASLTRALLQAQVTVKRLQRTGSDVGERRRNTPVPST